MGFIAHSKDVETYLAESTAIGAGLFVIKGTAANQALLPSAADLQALGVTIYGATAAGLAMSVAEEGLVDLVVNAAGTNIAFGDPIAIHGTTGRGKKAGLTNTTFVCAVAREAATADGVTIKVRLCRNFMPAS